jgi:biotin operon repressor
MTHGESITHHDGTTTTLAAPPDIAPRQMRAREAVARAVEASETKTPRTEVNARLRACREAVVAYAKSLRDEGMSVASVVAQVKALVRGAPARSASSLRDVLAQWTITAYYQAD